MTENTQALFDIVVDGMFSQHHRGADDDDGRDMYRTKEGLCCAIGHLIGDRYYSKSLEGKQLQHPKVIRAIEKSIKRKLGKNEISMLIELQGLHDCMQPEEWYDHLVMIANFHLVDLCVTPEASAA